MKISLDLSGGGLAEMVSLADFLERNLRLWGLKTKYHMEYTVEGHVDERMENLAQRGVEVEISVFNSKG